MREQSVLFESTSLGEARLEVRSLEGHDELNQLFRYVAVVARPGVQMSADDAILVLDSPVTLRFEEEGRLLHQIHGIAAEVSTRIDVESDRTELTVEIVPRVFALTQRRGSEIFVDRSVPEVLAEKLTAIGLAAGVDFLLPLRETYPTREFIAQYEETDHAFVARLCERYGITTFFEHQSGRDVWVLTDTSATFQPIERAHLPVRRRRSHPAAYDVQTTLRRVPAEAENLDYNYRTPLVALREKKPTVKPAAVGGWIEYGPHSKTVDETRAISRVRTEELGARHHSVAARTTEASVRAGGTVHLEDAAGHDQHLLIVRVHHRHRAVDATNGGETWENEIACIPAAVTYRPPRVTPWPNISGLLNAVVDGAIKGHYAELDESGRYHLRMMYDRSERTNLGATHPVRMMQPHAGANYGMHFPLRPGAEVLVGFVNGDPDRPVIVGSAPNPVTSSPVVQQNQTQNVLRTGSNNEMVIEDEHGNERIRIHTPHMRTTVQLGSIEEAEEGALTTTEAHISEASRLSNNEVTNRKTLMADSAASLLGRSVVFAAGTPSLTAAAKRGIEQPGAVSPEDVYHDLSRLSAPPESRAAAGPEEQTEDRAAGGPGGGALWSAIAANVTEATQSAMNELVRAVASTTDSGLDSAIGRLQGEPLGQPMDPSAVLAAERTAALVGREMGVVFGDRVAAVSSFHTASVMGKEMAFLKSPGSVEVAAGREAKVTTAGPLDIEARLVRLVGGYYPEAEAPPLDEGTSIGVMSRKDLRLLSVEDCILLCAKKNLIGAAHTGDMKLSAKNTMSLKAGGLTASAGSITLSSGDTIKVDANGDITVKSGGNVTVEAAGDVVVKGATVTVEAGSITLSGPVLVDGDLTVSGALNGG